MLVLLGEIPPRGLHWLQPGAFHHARWMSTILYSAKMYAFGKQLYDQTKMDSLHRICLFNALLHVKFWLSATSAVDAPVNDLQFWNDLKWFRKVDPVVADAALTALNRHLWYLTEEITPLALFSNLVSDAEKKQIARQLLRMKDDAPLQLGVPTFPELASTTKLSSLIGKQSWLLFQLLEITPDWLKLSPSQWHSDDMYHKAATVVKHCRVVNDLAERAVKLITDFATTLTKDETQRQYLLQVVEHHRRQIPDFKKSTLFGSKD
jgi:hypothetical protein